MIGSVIADELFDGRAPIGEAFRIGNVPFTVIGVLDKRPGAAGRSQDDIAFIPLSSAKSRVLGAVRGTTRDALDLILVKLADAAAMEGMQSEIETLLTAPPHPRRGDERSLGWPGFCSASTRRIAPPNSIQLWRCALNKLMDARLIKMPCLVMAVRPEGANHE